jgi:cysteine desulfurase
LLTGGGQELGRRAGTENVAAIAGFARAVELTTDMNHMKNQRKWLDGMESQMEVSGGTVFGKGATRLPNTTCVAMPKVSGEVQLMDFDLKGMAVSSGSACSSGRIEGSHVLAAMGVPHELAASAIRISAGWATTEGEITAFSKIWKETCLRLRKIAS